MPLEELVDGMRVENERGEFFRVDSSVHLEIRHGDVPLSRFHAIEPETVGILTAEPELEAFDIAARSSSTPRRPGSRAARARPRS